MDSIMLNNKMFYFHFLSIHFTIRRPWLNDEIDTGHMYCTAMKMFIKKENDNKPTFSNIFLSYTSHMI